MSRASELCAAAAALIAENAAVKAAGARVFCEDRGDPAKMIWRNDRTRLRVMVAATGHRRRAGGGSSTAGDISLEVTVFENPKLRRGDAATLTEVSEAIAETLHWKEACGAKLRYIDMERADADDEDYRMALTFMAFLAFDPARAVTWGVDGATVCGEVTEKTVERGGENAWEANRRGDAQWVGTRDKHWRAQLTCAVEGIDETSLPELGSTFEFGGRSYVCESASIASAVEDVSTVKLSGRTMIGDRG